MFEDLSIDELLNLLLFRTEKALNVNLGANAKNCPEYCNMYYESLNDILGELKIRLDEAK